MQEILAVHRGQVTVESAEGQGTTVTVTLPRAVDDTAQAQSADHPGDPDG